MSRQSSMSGMRLCRDNPALSRQSPVAPTRARSVEQGSLSRALVRACCAVLSPHNFCIATQGLLASVVPYRNSGLGHDIEPKGLSRDRENLCRDPSHPVPTPNLITPLKFCRDTGQAIFVSTGLPPRHGRTQNFSCAHAGARHTLVATLVRVRCHLITAQKTLSHCRVQGALS